MIYNPLYLISWNSISIACVLPTFLAIWMANSPPIGLNCIDQFPHLLLSLISTSPLPLSCSLSHYLLSFSVLLALSLLPYSTDVNVAFQQAMVKVGIENEDLMKQFKLTVTLPQQEERRPQGPGPATKKGEGAWKHLNLAHSVSWPLHILFTPAILEK